MTHPALHRAEPALAALGVLTPMVMMLTFASYARDRASIAWHDERGLSKTVEIAMWTFLALGAAAAAAAILIPAIRNRATDTGNDIENTPLP